MGLRLVARRAAHGRWAAFASVETTSFSGMRYSVGFLFGAFLLVPYVAILYPAHLASIFDWQALEIFEGAFQLNSQGAFVFLRLYFVMTGITGIILVFTGLPVLRGAYISLKMRRPNTDLLVAITAVSAYAYSTAAVVLGQNDIFYDLAIVVVTAAVTAMVFYESSIKQRALNRLTELTISQVEHARTYDSDGKTQEVRVADLTSGDIVLVRQGERVPVDGELVEDSCTVDEAIVTGESLPVLKRAGDEIIGDRSSLTARPWLCRPDVTSSIDRITTAVWDLQSATHGVQRHADQLASYAVLLVVGAAVAIGGAGVIAFGMGIPDAVPRAIDSPRRIAVGSRTRDAALGSEEPRKCAPSRIIIFDETGLRASQRRRHRRLRQDGDPHDRRWR